MANSSIPLPSGQNADSVTVESGDHRQVVVLGSPTTEANVAEVTSDGALSVVPSGDALPTIGNLDQQILLELKRIALILADISGTYPSESELE